MNLNQSLAFAALSVALASPASAATYNFYLNNAEQGDNSSASPSVKSESSAAETHSQATPQEVRALPAPSLLERLQHRWVRLQGGMQIAALGSPYGSSLPDSQGSLLGSVTVTPSPYFGLTGFYGAVFGVEMDIIPGISSTGKTEIGALFGVSRITSRPGTEGILPHAGMRFTWNMNYPWGVTLVGRVAPSSYDSYVSLEGGLTFSL